MWRIAALLLAIATAFAASACGSGKSSSAASSAAGSSSPSVRNVDAIDRARVRASSCMRSHGIEIPDVTTGSGQVLNVLRIIARYPAAQVQAAEQACASSIRQAFPNAFATSPQERARRLHEAVVFAQCMRSHGIAYPDPSTAASNLPAFLNGLISIDRSSPAYKAAAPGCRAQALRSAG